MDTFDVFREQLREALAHLHDPDYHPSEMLCAVLGCSPKRGAGPAVQYGIMEAIQILKPSADVPPAAADRRDYDLLHHRFVSRLTQEEAAECMHMSVRNLRRAQRSATHRLARLLWEHRIACATTAGDAAQTARDPLAAQDEQARDWRSQLRQDLASLQTSSATVVTDVGEAIRTAVELESVLSSRHGIGLRVEGLPSPLLAALHPSVLRQVLIMAIAELVRCASPGQITLQASVQDASIRIDLAGAAPASGPLPAGELIREILAAQGGSVEVERDGERIRIGLQVPPAGEVTVLVVEDNPDSIHYYQRCATGTRYRIVHATQGEAAIRTAEETRPDIIVLDIMLPDTDGWDLLGLLRRNPATRSVPIIVCSIVREENLASALGAVLYLPKPVRRQEFVQALDRALSQVTIEH